MKILIITPYYKPAFIYGGPVNSISKISEKLGTDSSVDIAVFTTNAGGENNMEVATNVYHDVNGVKVSYFRRYFNGNSFFVSPSLTWNVLRSIAKYDIVHVNMWWNWVSIFGAAIAIICRKQVVLSPRGSITEYIVNYKNKRLKTLVHKYLGKHILKKVHFHLTSLVELRDTKLITTVYKYNVIYNLIDLPKLDIPATRTKNDIFTLVYLSRIHEKKGLELLLNAIATIETPLRLKIAGDGDQDYIIQLKLLAKSLNIEDKIEWLGWQDNSNKFRLLVESDLFVLTSYNENFANVVIESLHSSTPVFVTDGVGLSTFITDNDLGWVAECHLHSITTTLASIPFETDKLNRIRRSAPEIISSNFSAEKLSSEYLAMYQNLINTNKE